MIGASGFVGRAIVGRLEEAGWRVISVSAPRLTSWASDESGLISESLAHEDVLAALQGKVQGTDIVVLAAGLATPNSSDVPALIGANALLPVLVARAAARAGCEGFVHISSAAVQGRVRVLDESEVTTPFSPYSTSKALGESALLVIADSLGLRACIFRATSVHGNGRPTTAALRRVARSPLSSVAAPGSAATPIVSVSGLARAVAFLLPRLEDAPSIVLQPAEGATTRSVLTVAGSRAPLVVPALLARLAVVVGYGVFGRVLPATKGHVRRVELMWFGQDQDEGWLTRAGFEPIDEVHACLAPDGEVPARQVWHKGSEA
ncbi:NAD-dependent epimerase/dehydratase family protein [Frigoribacterium sp. PvP032]|uniref:NAD-dependent epimerase/dehydratase family protein n=1 Tax=Frigoribacterium sp. PvP032 TaxID=2806589 RepID=UPI0035A9A8F5